MHHLLLSVAEVSLEEREHSQHLLKSHTAVTKCRAVREICVIPFLASKLTLAMSGEADDAGKACTCLVTFIAMYAPVHSSSFSQVCPPRAPCQAPENPPIE